jgi:integrase
LVDFIELALTTGGRMNELLYLRFSNVDLKRNILTFEAKTTKINRTRYFPINRLAGDVLERRRVFKDLHCPESPWMLCNNSGKRYESPRTSFNKVLKMVGIEGFRIHDLRHRFASWLVSEGGELVKMRDLLAHSSIKMTGRYAHLAPERLHKAIRVLDSFLLIL